MTGQWYGISSSSSSISTSGSSLWMFIPENDKEQPLNIEIESNSVYPISSSMTIEQNTLWKHGIKTATSHPGKI